MQAMFEEKSFSDKLRSVFWIILIAGVAVVLFVISRGETLPIRSQDAYQAVFLDNGQVYFGKLRAANKNFLSLTDIYYLRAGTVVQQESGALPATPSGQVELIKLGAELHGPRDEMMINKEHMLFYEELGEDGEVMKLIRAHKSGQ